MANELKATTNIKFVNGNAFAQRNFNYNVDVTGTKPAVFTQTIGTSEEVLAFPADYGTPGYILLINQDATNFIEVGPATGAYLIKLKAGESALFRSTVAKTSFYCKADTANCDLEVVGLED